MFFMNQRLHPQDWKCKKSEIFILKDEAQKDYFKIGNNKIDENP